MNAAFAATGGAWLPNRRVVLAQHDLELVGMGIRGCPRSPLQTSRDICC